VRIFPCDRCGNMDLPEAPCPCPHDETEWKRREAAARERVRTAITLAKITDHARRLLREGAA